VGGSCTLVALRGSVPEATVTSGSRGVVDLFVRRMNNDKPERDEDADVINTP
jgi:hypothetical protein